jgi:putative transcriptional regulator
MSLKYTGCALQNVYLKNGFEILETRYGKGITIHDLDGLHVALGKAIIANPKPLLGSEFRFLREELDLSQKGLAALLGRDYQAVARWEKGKNLKVDPSADRLLRVIYLESKVGDNVVHFAVQMLKKMEANQSLGSDLPIDFIATSGKDAWVAKADPKRKAKAC